MNPPSNNGCPSASLPLGAVSVRHELQHEIPPFQRIIPQVRRRLIPLPIYPGKVTGIAGRGTRNDAPFALGNV
jgi:hypothetical protein